MNDVFITGAEMTKFGKDPDKDIIALAVEAGLKAINDTGQDDLRVDGVYVGTAASG